MPLAITEFSARTAQIGPSQHVITVAGELDLYSTPRLEQEIASVLEEGTRTVILDLLGVTFLDSTALGVITGAAKRTRGAGGDLLLVTDRHDVLRVFRITGLDRFLTVRSSLAAAVAGVSRRTA